MIYASAANTPARLGIGSADQILKVSGGVPTWATVSTGPTFIGAAAYNANFTLAGTGENLIAFPNEDFDTNAFHDNSTNNSRLTVPAGYAGKYLVMAHMDLNGISGYYICSIRQYNSAGGQLTINGTNRQFTQNSGGNNFAGGTLAYIVSAAVGDYFQVFWNWQGQTALTQQNCRFQIQYLGA
jgi:hypothetical protein